jgi:hypothetical protein
VLYVFRGDDDDGKVAVEGAELSKQFAPVHGRHFDVRHDHRGSHPAEAITGSSTIWDCDDLESFVGKTVSHEGPPIAVVIDDQHHSTGSSHEVRLRNPHASLRGEIQ